MPSGSGMIGSLCSPSNSQSGRNDFLAERRSASAGESRAPAHRVLRPKPRSRRPSRERRAWHQARAAHPRSPRNRAAPSSSVEPHCTIVTSMAGSLSRSVILDIAEQRVRAAAKGSRRESTRTPSNRRWPSEPTSSRISTSHGVPGRGREPIALSKAAAVAGGGPAERRLSPLRNPRAIARDERAEAEPYEVRGTKRARRGDDREVAEEQQEERDRQRLDVGTLRERHEQLACATRAGQCRRAQRRTAPGARQQPHDPPVIVRCIGDTGCAERGVRDRAVASDHLTFRSRHWETSEGGALDVPQESPRCAYSLRSGRRLRDRGNRADRPRRTRRRCSPSATSCSACSARAAWAASTARATASSTSWSRSRCCAASSLEAPGHARAVPPAR